MKLRTVGSRTIRNSARPDKPNEDALVCDDQAGIYIIADGVTSSPPEGGPYPVPSGGFLASRAFCGTLHEALAAIDSIQPTDVWDAIKIANAAVGELNRKRISDCLIDYDSEDLCGVVASIGVVIEAQLHVWHLGDCMIAVRDDRICHVATECQTQAVHEYEKRREAELARQLILQGRASGPSEIQELRRHLRIESRRDHRNSTTTADEFGRPLGYGVFTGESSALGLIQSLRLEISAGNEYIFATDGLTESVEKLCALGSYNNNTAQREVRGDELLDWFFSPDACGQSNDDKTAFLLRSL